MRKNLFVLFLVVLTLFSFSSCSEEDKSEEVITDFVRFKRIENLADKLQNLYSAYVKTVTEEGIDVNGEISTGAWVANQIVKIVTDFDEGHDIDTVDGKLPVSKGKLKGTVKLSSTGATDELSLTFDNVEITCYYQEKDEDDNPVGTTVEKKMSVSGSMKFKKVGTYGESYESAIVIDGESYIYSYTLDEEEYKYNAATVNGRAVDLRMLNAKVIR